MPGYQTLQQCVPITGAADLLIRSLLDRQQFSDPFGVALGQGICSATWPLFGLLWPSGEQLAARIALRPVQSGERILELGCGLALPSLVCHRRGADITASDCHPLTQDFLRVNLELNRMQPMKYRHGHWSRPGSLLQEAGVPAIDMVRGRFDLIIGSDLLYDPDASVALAGFIGRHAQPGAEVWIVDPDRGNRPAFNRHMQAHGFDLHEERLDRVAVLDTPAYKGRLLTYRRAARVGGA